MKLKLSKKTNKDIEVVCMFLLVMGGAFGSCFATYKMMQGYHNVDLAWNFERIGLEIGSTFTDTGQNILTGETITMNMTEWYMHGQRQVQLSFGAMIICVAGLTLGAVCLAMRGNEK